jgi:hypothetical protein
MLVLVITTSFLINLSLMACSPAITPEDAVHIANHGVTLERCKAEGREAGSYQAYEDCKKDAGINGN